MATELKTAPKVQGGRLYGIDYLLDLNEKHAALFHATKTKRQEYRENHPMEINALKCMDGRLNLSLFTNTSFIMQPWRDVGGKFDLGWVGFRDAMIESYRYALGKQRTLLNIITYHYSRGDKHRGCAGFQYDTEAAKTSAFDRRDQFVRVFKDCLPGTVYSIMIGIETDLDALVLHGDDKKMPPLDLSTVVGSSPKNLMKHLKSLYPGMPKAIREHFLPIIAGNIEHIAEIRAANRPVTEIQHQEDTLVVGRAADWLHVPNKALIVGPYNPELREPIKTAATVLLNNLNEGRVPKENGIVLMALSPFKTRRGYDRAAAQEKAQWLHSFAMRVIKEEVPDLVPYLSELTALVDMNTRKLEVLHRS